MFNFESTEIIFRLAGEVEDEGDLFYTRLAQAIPNPVVKDIFFRLAEDERRHKQDLSAIAHSLAASGFRAAVPLSLAQLMHSSAESFKEVMKGSEPVNLEEIDLARALAVGIRTEENAIRFYTGVKAILPATVTVVLDRIIHEEVGHRERLLQIKEQKLS